MKLSQGQQKKILVVLIALIVLINGYNYFTREAPKTAPLTYTHGAVASSPVRQGALSPTGEVDPLNVFFAQKRRKYPGVSRDIFRMENPKPKPKLPPPSIITAPTPTIPQKTPEQIAEDMARAQLSKFRFLGYLTEKDNTLFLSMDGELVMGKSGDIILKSYIIKETGKDFVVLMDMSTRVEVRVVLSGGAQASPAVQPQRPAVQPQRPAWQPQRPAVQPQRPAWQPPQPQRK
jgi:hypothetical protein